jgi:hypothetical protein
MSRSQARPGGTDVAPRPTIGTAAAAGPINGHAREQRVLECKNAGSQEKEQSNNYGESFHFSFAIS